MSKKTIYSCDNCGLLIECKGNESKRPLAFAVMQGESKYEHRMYTVDVQITDVRNGDRYAAASSSELHEPGTTWELCNDCGTQMMKVIEAALKGRRRS